MRRKKVCTHLIWTPFFFQILLMCSWLELQMWILQIQRVVIHLVLRCQESWLTESMSDFLSDLNLQVDRDLKKFPNPYSFLEIINYFINLFKCLYQLSRNEVRCFWPQQPCTSSSSPVGDCCPCEVGVLPAHSQAALTSPNLPLQECCFILLRLLSLGLGSLWPSFHFNHYFVSEGSSVFVFFLSSIRQAF